MDKKKRKKKKKEKEKEKEEGRWTNETEGGRQRDNQLNVNNDHQSSAGPEGDVSHLVLPCFLFLFFFYFWEYDWVGPVGYLFSIDVGFFFFLAYSVTIFFFLRFSVTIYLFIFRS